MLAKRIIPVMLVRGDLLVKGRGFSCDRVVGSAIQAARVHASREVDELCILDISATAEGRGPDIGMIATLTEDSFIPVSVGGGVRTDQQIRDLLLAGADKVVIGQAFRNDPDFVRNAAYKYGSQAITVSIDYPKQDISDAIRAVDCGAGEILLNNMERDGTMAGYDIELIEAFSDLSVPVIACGGCESYDDMEAAFCAGASAVGVGALFLFDDATPNGAAKYLLGRGLEVRCVAA